MPKGAPPNLWRSCRGSAPSAPWYLAKRPRYLGALKRLLAPRQVARAAGRPVQQILAAPASRRGGIGAIWYPRAPIRSGHNGGAASRLGALECPKFTGAFGKAPRILGPLKRAGALGIAHRALGVPKCHTAPRPICGAAGVQMHQVPQCTWDTQAPEAPHSAPNSFRPSWSPGAPCAPSATCTSILAVRSGALGALKCPTAPKYLEALSMVSGTL